MSSPCQSYPSENSILNFVHVFGRAVILIAMHHENGPFGGVKISPEERNYVISRTLPLLEKEPISRKN